LNERRKIAQILNSVDESIQSAERFIAKRRKVKQGLMEDLLTGRVRVKVDEDAAV
jgi:type I restriction enzyme, S subunit